MINVYCTDNSFICDKRIRELVDYINDETLIFSYKNQPVNIEDKCEVVQSAFSDTILRGNDLIFLRNKPIEMFLTGKEKRFIYLDFTKNITDDNLVQILKFTDMFFEDVNERIIALNLTREVVEYLGGVAPFSSFVLRRKKREDTDLTFYESNDCLTFEYVSRLAVLRTLLYSLNKDRDLSLPFMAFKEKLKQNHSFYKGTVEGQEKDYPYMLFMGSNTGNFNAIKGVNEVLKNFGTTFSNLKESVKNSPRLCKALESYIKSVLFYNPSVYFIKYKEDKVND